MNVDRPQGASTDVAKFYVAGGTLSPDVPSYISRQADEDLYDGLSGGEFCYVLTSRQMGKSSLMVRTAARLRDAGSTVAMLDVTSVGQQVTPDQWYDGLAMGLGQALDMEDELEAFWLDHERLSPVQRWIETLRAAVLPNIDGPLVVFVDEIDTVRSLPFPTDEFFAAIRACYNRRSQVPEFARLTFCLLGVSTPTDLVRNPQTTPFNIGRRIELEDFTEDDITALAPGMARLGDSATHVLSRVLHWTGGHPYLTQRLCEAVAKDEAASGPADVDRLCDDLYLSRRAREQDTNLTFARDRVLRGGDMEGLDRASVLTLYGQALRGQDAPADDANPVVSLLKIAGLVRSEDGHLRVRNRIYERVFDKVWIRENIPDAELRRQRVAFVKGVLRTAAIAAAIIAVVTAFLVHSIRQEHRVQRLLAQSQVDRGMQLLEARDTAGLLHLVEAAGAVKTLGEERHAIASLWAGWAQEHVGRTEFVGGHDGGVTDVAYSPDGRRLVTTSYDRTVRMWDVQTGKLIGVSPEYERTTRSVAFSPDGWRIAVGRGRGFIELLGVQPQDGKLPHIDTLEHVSPSEALDEGVYDIDVSADGRLMATVGLDGGLQLWKVDTWTPYGPPIELPTLGFAVALSPDGGAVASTGTDNTLRTWDTRTGRALLPPIPCSTGSYQRITFAPGENLVTVRTAPNALQLWDIDSNQPVGPTFTAVTPIISVAFSPDGSLVACGTADGAIQVYDRATGREVAVLPRHMGRVFAITFSPDGTRLASGSMDGSVRVVRLDLSQDRSSTLWDDDTLADAHLSGDGARLIAAFRDGTAQVWDTDTGDPIGGPLHHGEPARAVLMPPDGRIAVTAGERPGIKVWETATGRALGAAAMTEGTAGLQYSPDGRRILLFPAGHVEIWDVTDGPTRVGSFQVTSALGSVSFNQAGSRIAVGEYRNVAWIWDIRSAKRLSPAFQHDRAVGAVAFSNDGTLLATGSRDQRARLWSIDDGDEVGLAMHHSARVEGVGFSPDDTVLATASEDGVLRLWDVQTHKQIGAPRRLGTTGFGVIFAPDGQQIVTHSSSMSLWHVATGRLYPSPLRQPDSRLVATPRFRKDSRRLVAAFEDGRIRHWDTPYAPATFREMQLRTWIDLAVRLNDQGVVEPIPWEEWRELRDELNRLRANALDPSS